jgi:hypothetical protein
VSAVADRTLLDAFEACALPSGDFHHRDHVHVAWLYLRESPLLEALTRFTSSLKRFATHHGTPSLYHETITWAYVALIHERMERQPQPDWEIFERDNPDLLTWKPSLLDRYYTKETLTSELARRTFVFPDRY